MTHTTSLSEVVVIHQLPHRGVKLARKNNTSHPVADARAKLAQG